MHNLEFGKQIKTNIQPLSHLFKKISSENIFSMTSSTNHDFISPVNYNSIVEYWKNTQYYRDMGELVGAGKKDIEDKGQTAKRIF